MTPLVLPVIVPVTPLVLLSVAVTLWLPAVVKVAVKVPTPLVSGLGLAMIARYVPARMGGFMMGAYFVATGISQYLGSVVANYASIPQNLTDPLESLAIYTALFNKLGFVAIGGTALAVLLLPLMKKLSATHHESNGDAAAAGPLRAVTVEE